MGRLCQVIRGKVRNIHKVNIPEFILPESQLKDIWTTYHQLQLSKS